MLLVIALAHARVLSAGPRGDPLDQAVAAFHTLLFEPYFADLGGELRPLHAAAVGLGVWAITVALSDLLRRFDRPGPAEALLRRLVDGARS